MQPLVLDPPVPFLLPSDRSVVVALVGCGGTGSHLAFTLARLAYHCREAGLPPVDLLFIDGDHVEAKNVGRQLFAPAEVGQNKAQTLASRLNLALGLNIGAMPMMATPDLLSRPHVRPPGDAIGILVGAVDGADGRLALQHGLTYGGWRMWLDCGNHESSGQVCAGTHSEAGPLAKAFKVPGVCAALPAPSVLYPELLQAPKAAPGADCAAAMQDNAQSLLVNQMMAGIAGEYLYQLIVRRRLTTFRTVVDLGTLTMRSEPITARTIAAATPQPASGRRSKKAKAA
jgi:PRTRC genetic system ThiF family protein